MIIKIGLSIKELQANKLSK